MDLATALLGAPQQPAMLMTREPRGLTMAQGLMGLDRSGAPQGAPMSQPPSLAAVLAEAPVTGGTSEDHTWNAKAGRWQAPDGKFLPGEPPKDKG
jgi:hypothetical protein